MRCTAFALLGSSLPETDPELALSVQQAHISLLGRRWPHDKQALLDAQLNMGACLAALSRYDEALHYERAAYAGRVALLGAADKQTIVSANNLACSLADLKLFAEAKKLARETLPVSRQELGPRHQFSIRLTIVLSTALRDDPTRTRADVVEAEALLVDVLKTARVALGPRHPNTIAIVELLEDTRRVLAQPPP